jgi:predicted acetyltransferase
VVDAKTALEHIKKDDEGKFTIRVSDNFAKWNNNVYTVEYGGGECTVIAGKTGANDADIEVSECALMQMILGVFEFEQVIGRGDVQLNANKQTLERIFRKKNMLLADYF